MFQVIFRLTLYKQEEREICG